MNKKLVTLAVALIVSVSALAQDFIYMPDGEKVFLNILMRQEAIIL